MIKAIFPAGVTDITVNGLHQWDYGQKLEIQADDLPGVVEVHFSCAGMDEAVVRVCNTSNGVVTAAIPDRCLEQTGPVTAWVYVIDGTAGETTKTVLLPIIPRTRPAASTSIPEEVSDKYTEVITAANVAVSSAVEALRESGDAIAGSATNSVIAKLGGFEFADGSVQVAKAFYATVANQAVEAETAKKASTIAYESSQMLVVNNAAAGLDIDLAPQPKALYVAQIYNDTTLIWIEAGFTCTSAPTESGYKIQYKHTSSEKKLYFLDQTGAKCPGTVYLWKIGG